MSTNSEPIINKLHGDKVIWIIVILLYLVSIALIYSSSSSLAFKSGTTNFSFLIEQCKFIVFGILALYICYKIPMGIYRFFTNFLFIGSVILLLLTPVIGKEINGAKRWLEIGPLTFQPAEIVKITLIMYIAKTVEVFRLDTFKEFFIRIIAPIGGVCILIIIGSVSTALMVGGLCLLILIIVGTPWTFIFKSIGIGSAVFAILLLLHLAFGIFPRFDTAINRVKRYVVKTEISAEASAEEKQKKADENFQEDMAKVAVSSGKLIGKGPGKSTQRYVLPHPYSDFIYSIIIEEYGLLGGCFVLMLYTWFLYRCIMLIRRCTKKFTAITVGGLGLMIVLQAMLHILVNVGILPVTGHTLPLVSLGGTSLVIFSCAFGIILSISRTIEMDSRKQQEREAAVATAGNGNNEIIQPDSPADSDTEYMDENPRRYEEPEFHEIIDKNTGEFR